MTTVGSISQTVVDLTDKVMGTGTAQAGEEPPSGIQGAGTATEPYDQGNAPGKLCAIATVLTTVY